MLLRLLPLSLIALSFLSLHAVEENLPEADVAPTAVEASESVIEQVDTTGMSKHVVIAGTFKMQEKSDSQLVVLVRALNAKPEIVALKQSYGFDYVSRASGDYFVVAIEPIYGQETVQKILLATREVFADAYEYVRPKKKTIAPVLKVDSAAEEAAPVEAEVTAPASAVAEVEPAAVIEEPVAEPEAMEPPVAEEKAAAPEPVPLPVSIPEPVKKPAAQPFTEPLPAGAEPGISDMLIYGGAAVVILLLVVIMMIRGKKEKRTEIQAIEIEEKTAEEETPPPVEEVPEATEPAVTPVMEETATEVVEEKPLEVPAEPEVTEPTVEVVEEAEPAEEQVEPVVEEVPEEPIPAAVEEVAVETAEPLIEEVVEEAVPAPVEEVTIETAAPVTEEAPAVAAAAPTEAAGRKKREPKADRGKIHKEDMAEFSGNRILIAEDNLINQKVLMALLASSGMELVVANDGQEAVDALAADSNFQMILMDAHMPEKDGFEASREIRANSAYDHVPIIALSGDIGADDLRAMAEAGMEEQLAKPIHLEDLYDVMYCYFDLNVEDEAEEEEEEIELLPDTDELHAEDGLEISGGDEELYKEILQEFVLMYGKSDETLNNFIVHDDGVGANALLLDVHGIAANIGASQLAIIADELREAILEEKEAKYTPLYESYCQHLHKLIADIKKI
ncbi:MAG: response regulator [Campylobacterota bacterium]|nr:response regulator [Campylobacterota bacterium]